MTHPTLYGIKNCDTVKKAFKWLDQNQIEYDFHDYKKLGADKAVLEKAFAQHGWEKVINQRGTTWRKLDQSIKDNINTNNAMTIALEQPSIIKRPLLVYQNQTYLGFKEAEYQAIFNK